MMWYRVLSTGQIYWVHVQVGIGEGKFFQTLTHLYAPTPNSVFRSVDKSVDTRFVTFIIGLLSYSFEYLEAHVHRISYVDTNARTHAHTRTHTSIIRYLLLKVTFSFCLPDKLYTLVFITGVLKSFFTYKYSACRRAIKKNNSIPQLGPPGRINSYPVEYAISYRSCNMSRKETVHSDWTCHAFFYRT